MHKQETMQAMLYLIRPICLSGINRFKIGYSDVPCMQKKQHKTTSQSLFYSMSLS